MSKTTKHIVALLIILVPFYLSAILQKFLFEKEDVLVEEFFGYYLMLSMLGVLTVLLTNKYLLGNKLDVFFTRDRKFLYDITLAFLLLGAFYFIQSVERITYGNWIHFEADRTAIDNLIQNIFSNYLYGIIIIGPFTWFEEAFTVFSMAFILNNLWEIKKDKIWTFGSIFFAASLLALLQVNNGPSAMITSFLLISLSNFIYYKYRSILPLFLAGVLFQTIDLIAYWIYVM
nr:hypothetical protein [uncultured Draconibacterium sp.]